MKLYQATLEDLEGVSHLFNLYRVFYQQASDLKSARAFIQERLTNEDAVIFIVKDNDQYVGFIQLYPSFSSVSMNPIWILNDLYIEASARKQGVGELLLQKAKDFAITTGAKRISLSTAIDNDSAQRLY